MGFFLYNIGTGEEMKKANLTSQIDGETQVFTLPETYKAGSLRVYWNGVRQIVDVSFSETSNLTFTTTFTPQTSEYLAVEYVQV